MLTRIKQLGQSKFVRNVAIVATGTAGAQAITMAFAPVITRLYGPEAFGLLGTFMAILGVLTPIAALTYPIAIVLPKSDTDAKKLAKLSALVALIVTSIAAAVLLTAGDWIADALSLGAVAGFLLLIPLAMLFAAFQQIFTQWLIRKKQFRITAKVAVLQAFIMNSAKAGAGWFHPVGAVLIVIAVGGQALHALLLWAGTRSKEAALPDNDESAGTLRELANRHKDFPLYRAPQVALNALSQSLPILMLASFFGPAAAGFYTLGRTVMGVPSTLIGGAVGDVFYPRIAEAANNKEKLFNLVLKATGALAAVGFVPFFVVIATGPWLFSFVFGAEWVDAGEYARWIALWMYFMFMNSPSNKTIPVLKIQGFYLFFTVFTILIRLVGLGVGYFVFSSDLVAIAIFGVSGAVINVVIIAIVLLMAKKFDSKRSSDG
ncbi:lipopolysaccharide biosynthesis protein [Halopseudomonas formosensis]|uniref:lipopolysaccharide biosynthesis protein n=1 Tax=Halopseudomonas formosensis TaxID=1002526 RepID=UPI001C434A6F|nr:oligosaccharide flippase family protein [Halopseudomonas formosensis]